MPGRDIEFESHRITSAGWCPNNPLLPVLVYRAVHLDADSDVLAVWFEARFQSNGWPPAWRYTIYPYAHYHSTSHEVIGIYRGSARVRLGDTAGITIHCRAGDALLIPAGVSHERVLGTPDFHGVGAYPVGCKPDEMRGRPGERPAADRRIATLPIPNRDPIAGLKGPLQSEWHIEAGGDAPG